MNVMIAGGSGFIGSALSRSLLADGHQVWCLTRSSRVRLQGVHALVWDGRTCTGWLDAFSEMDAVVNLAGASIGQPFWTKKRKKVLVDSRVDPGLAIGQAFQRASKKPAVLVQASGAGYYGARGRVPLAEDASAGNDFLASLAVSWEASTRIVDALGVRRVIIRSGIVLGNGGILPLMALPARALLGGPLGDGAQGISWIHIDDEVAAIRLLLEDEKTRGVYNLTAPNPTSNAGFMHFLARALHRPYWLRVPAFALRIMLGEMSTLLLDGQFAIPQRLVNLGYSFKFESVCDALQDLLS
jgi:uncharacterized protein (TIGR01777 family)